MIEKIKNVSKIILSAIGVHAICCAPLLLPAVFGAAVSGTLLGSVSLFMVAAAYTGSYIMYKHDQNKVIQDENAQHICCAETHIAPKRYIRSKCFKNASFITAGIALGVVFNSIAPHNHDHNHEEHERLSIEKILTDPQNMCRSKP